MVSLTREELERLYDNDFINTIVHFIIEEVNATYKEQNYEHLAVSGGSLFQDVTDLQGWTHNLWIEYDAHLSMGRSWSGGLKVFKRFEDCPDEILDRINELKARDGFKLYSSDKKL